MLLFGMPRLPAPLKGAIFFLFQGLTPLAIGRCRTASSVAFNPPGFRKREVQSLRFDCVAPLGLTELGLNLVQ